MYTNLTVFENIMKKKSKNVLRIYFKSINISIEKTIFFIYKRTKYIRVL